MSLVFTDSPDLEALAACGTGKVLVLTDENVSPLIDRHMPRAATLPRIVIPAGEDHKTLHTVTRIWDAMIAAGLTRHDTLLNVGGGVVTDMGGFAAATFKRGIDFVNVPTTLLAAVDASVGGKTGFDYAGLKNEIGAFARARTTIISTTFFPSLDRRQMVSGYAEMLKHALLDSPDATRRALLTDPADVTLDMLRESVDVKQRVVLADPREQGLRKILNLGHTAGHAIESLLLAKATPVPHGYAVAWGLVVAMVLSHTQRNMPSQWIYDIARWTLRHCGAPAITCDDYPELLRLMHHDKKNSAAATVAFTLLDDPGRPVPDIQVADPEIRSALDIARDLLGI